MVSTAARTAAHSSGRAAQHVTEHLPPDRRIRVKHPCDRGTEPRHFTASSTSQPVLAGTSRLIEQYRLVHRIDDIIMSWDVDLGADCGAGNG